MPGDSEAEGEAGRVVTAETDGVRVEKSFEREEFPVPVVSFVLTSTADEPVELRLTDDIPESFEMEHVGFHPDFDNEKWTAYRDHRVEFVCTLDPGEDRRTVYGVRLDDEETIDDFLAEPDLERRDEAEDSDPDDVLGRETNQLVRDALAGDEVPGVEGSLGPGDDDVAAAIGEPADGAPVDEADDSVDAAAGPDSADSLEVDVDPEEAGTAGADETAAVDAGEPRADETESDDGTAPAPRSVDSGLVAAVAPVDGEATPADASTGAVASALAAELRAGAVADDDVAALREHLDVPAAEPSVPRSVEVRLDRCQSKLADLDAYTAALEEFLDENGTGEELVAGFREDVESLQSEVAAVEADLSDLRTTQRDLRDDLGDRTERLETSLTDQREELAERLDSLRGDLEADVADLRGRVETLESQVSDVESATAEDLDALAADVEELRDRVEGFREFRERMRSAFGD
jgi:chaperonin cofactor prefoldin